MSRDIPIDVDIQAKLSFHILSCFDDCLGCEWEIENLHDFNFGELFVTSFLAPTALFCHSNHNANQILISINFNSPITLVTPATVYDTAANRDAALFSLNCKASPILYLLLTGLFLSNLPITSTTDLQLICHQTPAYFYRYPQSLQEGKPYGHHYSFDQMP